MPATADTEDPVPTSARAQVLPLLGPAVALLLLLAFTSQSTAAAWIPKTAVMLAALPVALVVGGVLLRQGDRIGRLGVIFVAAAVVSTLASTNRSLSAVGPYLVAGGLPFFAALPALWALGRTARAHLLEHALLAGVVVNAAIAVAQAMRPLDAFELSLFANRSAGLYGNPVHLAAVLTGGLAVAWAAWTRTRRPVVPGLAAALIGAAIAASGSRWAFFGMTLGIGALLISRRTLGAMVFALVLGGGFVAGQVGLDTTSGPARVSETGVSDGSTTARLYSWTEALPAVADQPLMGAGPGRYHQATVVHRSEKLAEAGADSYFIDAHNIFVEIAVTLGIGGLAAFLAFLTAALRAARGPLLWATLGILALNLVQPLHPATTGLAFLTLGGAAKTTEAVRVRRPTLALALAFGVALGGWLLVADVRFAQARLDGDVGRAARAANALPPWPEIPDAIARLAVFDSVEARTIVSRQEAVVWTRRATERDPEDPRWWVNRGWVARYAGRRGEARAAFERALELNAYSEGAREGLEALESAESTSDGFSRTVPRPNK